MKFALFLLALIPLAYAASIPVEDEDIDKKLSVDEIFGRLKNLDLSNGCVSACEKHVFKFWTFLCTAACKIFFEKVTPATV